MLYIILRTAPRRGKRPANTTCLWDLLGDGWLPLPLRRRQFLEMICGRRPAQAPRLSSEESLELLALAPPGARLEGGRG
jgi:hypothetical protein